MNILRILGLRKIKPIKQSFDTKMYENIKLMISCANTPEKLEEVSNYIKQVGRYSPNLGVASMMEFKLKESKL